jgi:hypothetical protein
MRRWTATATTNKRFGEPKEKRKREQDDEPETAKETT